MDKKQFEQPGIEEIENIENLNIRKAEEQSEQEKAKVAQVQKAESKPKKEAPVAAEKHEPLKGQITVEDIPGVVPEEYKTVTAEENTDYDDLFVHI